jgi:excisionase family DNA binding protein
MREKATKNQCVKKEQGIANTLQECSGTTDVLKFDKKTLHLLTPEQVSELFNLKVRQVLELARQGRIPAIKVGRLWRFPTDSLRAWIEESQTTCISQNDINSAVNQIIREVSS